LVQWEALDTDLRQEALFLTRYDAVFRAVDAQIDIRNNDLATLVTICLDNQGIISQKKRKCYAERVPSNAFDLIEAAATQALKHDSLAS
jgi:hypothetical protein